MINVVLIGGGNVAHHLAKIFSESESTNLLQVYNRTLERIKDLKAYTNITNDINKIVKADIYIISISDTAIANMSKILPNNDAMVVHTSGSVPMTALKNHNKIGVFYPLQTFSKEREVSFNKIPLCIEANTKENLLVLKRLAKAITKKTYIIDSDQRSKLHTAAIFVNNFVNHLYHIGTEICIENRINPMILQPLIDETALKITNLSPSEAQTGPARRGDKITIEKHLENLTTNQQEIYKLLSHSIANFYGKKL